MFFLLGNLVSLCMKIIKLVVVVGLCYGFLTTFSMGPSYIFLLRAQVMEEGEETLYPFSDRYRVQNRFISFRLLTINTKKITISNIKNNIFF